MISCIEEICYRNNWISRLELKTLSRKYNNSDYAKYLLKISNEINENN